MNRMLAFMLCLLGAHATMKDCTPAVSTGHISSLTMTPAAPISGATVDITIDYTLSKTVTSGTATYTATFNGFPLPPTTNDLCTDMATTTTPCPINAGAVHFVGTSQIGDGTTHGTIAATTTWTDQDGEPVLCWGFTVRI
jgi:hypothetical protein